MILVLEVEEMLLEILEEKRKKAILFKKNPEPETNSETQNEIDTDVVIMMFISRIKTFPNSIEVFKEVISNEPTGTFLSLQNEKMSTIRL